MGYWKGKNKRAEDWQGGGGGALERVGASTTLSGAWWNWGAGLKSDAQGGG